MARFKPLKNQDELTAGADGSAGCAVEVDLPATNVGSERYDKRKGEIKTNDSIDLLVDSQTNLEFVSVFDASTEPVDDVHLPMGRDFDCRS